MPRKRTPLKKAVLLDCGPYPFNVFVCTGMDSHEINKAMKRKCGSWVEDDVAEEEFNVEDCDGCCIPLGKLETGDASLFVLILSEQAILSPGLMAHEVFHAVCKAFNSVGIDLEPGGNNEPWAYMIGYLVDQIACKFNSA